MTADPHQATDQAALATALEAVHAALTGAPIVTQLVPFVRFWPAELEHDDYFARNPRNPYCAAVVAPKVAKFRKKFIGALAQG